MRDDDPAVGQKPAKQTILAPAREGQRAPLRIAMLPAAYTGPEDFVREGFVAAVRERELDIDLIFAAPDLLELSERGVVARLHEELVAPARKVRAALWLGGISLGGYLALCCAEGYGAELSGLCLFAPYLGSHIITGEIARAPGLDVWQPGDLTDDDYERRIWRFVKMGAGGLPIHLGLARDDRFLDRHRLLAAALDPSSIDIIEGSHDWPTWRRLWENFLDARFAYSRS